MKLLQSVTLPVIKKHFNLWVLVAFCTGLLLVRAKLTQSVFYFFLLWNLFLAWLPFAVSSCLSGNIGLIRNKYSLFAVFFIWLVLYPNAPYIITDFIHLRHEHTVPLWFDLLLLMSFSGCGLWFGLQSMSDMFTIFRLRFTKASAWAIVTCTAYLSGFGIYLGRFLRYNSWDVVQKPVQLTNDIHTAFTHSPAPGITLGFGTFLLLAFYIFHTTPK